MDSLTRYILVHFHSTIFGFDCHLSSFVKGSKPGRQTGFDIDESDLLEMEQCQGVVVASAIFGTTFFFMVRSLTRVRFS